MADQDKRKDETGDAAEDGAEQAEAGERPAPAGGRDSAVPGVRRPPHTLDLKASEVKENVATEKPPEDAKASKAEDEASLASAPDDKTALGDDSPADAPSDISAASAPPAQEPPQRTTQAQVTGFVTHLAAGLLGGVAGVIGAALLLPHVPLPGGASQDYRQGIEKRIGGIEQRLQASARELEALKTAPAALGERLDRLEATLAALEETAAKGGDVARTAAIRAQVGEMTSAMESRIDALSQELAALPAGTGNGANAEQAERLDALRRDLDALRASAGSDGEARRQGAAVAIRLAALMRAAGNGEPFKAELAGLRQATPQDADLSALDAWADEGVATLAELQRDFPAARQAALDAGPRASAGDSLVDQLLESASSVVNIRRVDGGPGGGAESGPGAALARMNERLRQGDLKGAVTEAEGLPEPARQALGHWLEEARARIALDAAIASISDDLARRLAAGGQSR